MENRSFKAKFWDAEAEFWHIMKYLYIIFHFFMRLKLTKGKKLDELYHFNGVYAGFLVIRLS